MQCSPVIAGCMKWGQWGARFDTTAYRNMIEYCVSLGVTSFDHADIYGHYTTEAEFGQGLKASSVQRDKIQLITKCGIRMITPNRPENRIKSYNTSKEYILQSAEQSLRNLQTDYIDLLLIHRPDPLMNPQEIAEAFQQLKQSGKVLHTGVSNFMPHHTTLLHKLFPVEANQIEVSVTALDPFHNGQLDQCQEMKIMPMAWSPLGGGRLFSEEPDESIIRIRQVAEQLARVHQCSPENILLAFLHTHPSGIVPVLGTSRKERIQDAMEGACIRLSREEWFMLWQASRGEQVA